MVEHFERTTAINHEIFGDDFEPVDDRLVLEDVLIVRNAEADANPIIGKPIETIRWHKLGTAGKTEGPPRNFLS